MLHILWTGVTVDLTVQVKLHKEILLLHNEMDQQPIHHFWKQGWGTYNNTFINLTGIYTHPKGLEVIKTHTQCLDSHQVRSFNIKVKILLSKINHDIYPRGLHSFIKTCHSLTFTTCWKLLGFRNETYIPHGLCCFVTLWVTLCRTSKTNV